MEILASKSNFLGIDVVPHPSSRWRQGPCPVQNPQGLSVASSCLPGFPPKHLFWVHTLGQRQRWLRLSAIWVLSSALLVWAWPDLVWIFSLFLGQCLSFSLEIASKQKARVTVRPISFVSLLLGATVLSCVLHVGEQSFHVFCPVGLPSFLQ